MNKKIDFYKKSYIMGILNVTPNSFSDGGKYINLEKAIKRVDEMIEEGADIIDIGAQSTKPGAEGISSSEEVKRLRPVLEKLLKKDIIISVDTDKSKVAREVLKMGVDIINDVSGLKNDTEMASVVAEYDATLIVMHMKGRPKNMQENPNYKDVIKEIKEELAISIDIAIKAGVARDKIVIDPGIGFGKTTKHNLLILNRLEEFKELKTPILIGASRKSLIGDVLNLPVDERVEGSIGVAVTSVIKGANIIRVHDVKESVRAIKMVDAIIGISDK